MKNYLLSVDGGGSKTEFCVSDRQGGILASVTVGCSNYKSVGTVKTYENFREGIKLLEKKEIGLADICFSVWGISGCDSDNDLEILETLVLQLGFERENSYICNDGVLAFYAQADEPGIVVISGTGSVVLGIDEKGSYKRAGGWGYNISDIGSGYWIGAEALKRTLFYCDGYKAYEPLYEKVRAYFGGESFETLPFAVTEVTDYFEIAKLARLVAEAAEENETASLKILTEGAEYLAALAGNTYKRLNFHEDKSLNIVFSGGVLKCEVYQGLVKEAIGKQISLKQVHFFTQENAPSYGGIRLAKRLWSARCMQDGGNNE